MGLDAKQLNHLRWGAHTTGNIFTTAPLVRWFNYRGTYYMHVCMCELQLQIIHITLICIFSALLGLVSAV